MPVDGVGPTRPPAWIGSRVAHPAGDLTRSTAYYRDLLGLRPRGGFTDHDGYDGCSSAFPAVVSSNSPQALSNLSPERRKSCWCSTSAQWTRSGRSERVWCPSASAAWTLPTRTGIVVDKHFWTPTGTGS